MIRIRRHDGECKAICNECGEGLVLYSIGPHHHDDHKQLRRLTGELIEIGWHIHNAWDGHEHICPKCRQTQGVAA